MPHMSLQSLHLFGHGVEVFSIILLPRGLHSPKSGTAYVKTIGAYKENHNAQYSKENRCAPKL